MNETKLYQVEELSNKIVELQNLWDDFISDNDDVFNYHVIFVMRLLREMRIDRDEFTDMLFDILCNMEQD